MVLYNIRLLYLEMAPQENFADILKPYIFGPPQEGKFLAYKFTLYTYSHDNFH